MEITNNILANMLLEIGQLYNEDNAPNSSYRAKAFLEAGQKIVALPFTVTSVDQVKNIKGIGSSSQETIKEILETGQSSRLNDLRAKKGKIILQLPVQQSEKEKEKHAVLDLFQSIYGIGAVKANKLYDAGLRTLEDIWERGDLNDAQKYGLIWREHIDVKIPKEEIDMIKGIIASLFAPYRIKFDISGSYRREEPVSSDIDLLVEKMPGLEMVGILYLLRPYLQADLASGPTTYRGILRISDEHYGHRIDIRLISPENYPFALMYFTGSQRFNILMRQRAISFGMLLNEYGLYKDGVSYPVQSEEEIFTLLKVKYMAPVDRLRDLVALPLLD